MITQTYRPQSLKEALQLLRRPQTFPMGGGTQLSRRKNRDFAVVDLSALQLDQIQESGMYVRIGAAVTLHALLAAENIPEALKKPILAEAPRAVRAKATLGGRIASAGGRSSLLTALLALDAEVQLASLNDDDEPIHTALPIGDFLPLRRENLSGRLITGLLVPVKAALAFAREPKDGQTFLTLAIARWPSGRTRVTVGGWGQSPRLAMDGKDAVAAPIAVRNVCHEASDNLADAAKRIETAVQLAQHCLNQLEG